MEQLFKKRLPYAKKGQTYGPKLEDILADVCSVYGQLVKDVIEGDRRSEFVISRRMYFYVARKITDASHRDIAKIIGKDHSNCVHHFKLVEHWINSCDPIFYDDWYDFKKKSKIWQQYGSK